MRYFKQSLKADPTYFKSHVRRGLVSYGMTGKIAAGIKHLDKALALDSASDAALFWRGMLYLRNRDFEKSLQDWSKLARQNPEDPTFILLRASLYLELMDYERAFIDLKDIFAKNYNDENRFRGTQSTTDRTLDLQFAVSYITRTIYGLTDEASSHLKKGFCLMVLGHRDDASEQLKRSFKLQPSALSLFLTAVNYEHSEKHDSAFHYYDAALKLDNDIFDAHKKRAIYFSELKNWKTAYQHFENMIRLEPQLKLTYRLRSMVRIDFKDYYGAIMDLTRYLRIDSADHEIYVYRAQCKIAVEDFKGANQDYRKAIKVRPDKSDLYDLVVTSDLQLGDTTHALETITQYEGKFGVSSLLFSKKIRIYIDQNRIEDARSEFMKVAGDKFWLSMQGDKAQSLIYFLEGWLDYLQNDEERALRNLAKALSLNQENFEAKYLRGKLYLSRGDRTKALNDLKALAQAGYLNADALLKELE
jgi:tetratricopeptide (TPR) repeat protein